MDSRTKRRIYFSSPKIIFITPFCILIFKKAFKKTHKKKKKTLRDWNFLGENLVLKGDKSHTVHGYFGTSPSTIAGGVSRGKRAIRQRTPLLSPFVSTKSPSNSSKGARYVFNLPTLYSCVIQWFEDIALLGMLCWVFAFSIWMLKLVVLWTKNKLGYNKRKFFFFFFLFFFIFFIFIFYKTG